MPGFEPTESQLTIGAAHSLSTHKLQRDAGRGLGELHALQHLFDTEEEDYTKPTPRHVLTVDDVTRGLGLDRELETLLQRLLDSTRTDFNRRSGNTRLIGARGLLLSWLRGRGDEINAGLRLEIVRRADAYWRKRGAEDMRLVVKSLSKGGERSDHKYNHREPDGKGGYRYTYNEVKLSKPQLDRVLKRGNYSIISAGRNGEDAREKDMPHDHPEFHARHEKLRAELHKHGLKHTEVEGHYGSPEPSFIVYHHRDTKPRAAKGRAFVVHHKHESEFAKIRKLGKKFNQDSVIHSKGGSHELHYTTGAHVGEHLKGAGHDYKPRAADMYTKVKLPGRSSKFALRFSWDALHGKKDAVLKADHRFVIGLRKSGEQAGHKYVRRTPDGKGGWAYEYLRDAAHADREAAAASAKQAAESVKQNKPRAPKKPPFKISEEVERVRADTYAFDVAAGTGKKVDRLRVTVYPNNTMRVYAPNSGVDWLQADIHEKDQAELVKRANALRAKDQSKKSALFIPTLQKSARTLAVPTKLRPMQLEW